MGRATIGFVNIIIFAEIVKEPKIVAQTLLSIPL